MKPNSRVGIKVYNWLALLCALVIYVLLLGALYSIRKLLTPSDLPDLDKTSSSNPEKPSETLDRPILSDGEIKTRSRDKVWTKQENQASAVGVLIEESTLNDIRTNYLIPYNASAPTNYSGSTRAWAYHQDENWAQIMPKTVLKRLNYKRNGFFVECGASDGAFLSNSLLLEKTYNLTGLLVEADPSAIAILKNRNRHAWVAALCLSPERRPMALEMVARKNFVGHAFIPYSDLGTKRLTRFSHIYSRRFPVQCFPLDMVMAAKSRTEIDYFSLDVEGLEFEILKTIPFRKIHIKLISVKIQASNHKKIRLFLKSVGYKLVQEIKADSDYLHDDLYELSQSKIRNNININLT